MLEVGDPVPVFQAESGGGGTVAAAGLLGSRWVIYFYPKDKTPGCTVETREFGQELPRFRAAGITLYGCSTGGVQAKRDFARACGAPDLPLLADPDHSIAEGFGVWGERRFMGKTYLGVLRTTFLVGADGRVEHVWEGVEPTGHAAEVLAAARGSS
ncbi:MAG: peroxiredoxin [Candidatus Dormibacteria bacterium]